MQFNKYSRTKSEQTNNRNKTKLHILRIKKYCQPLKCSNNVKSKTFPKIASIRARSRHPSRNRD